MKELLKRKELRLDDFENAQPLQIAKDAKNQKGLPKTQ